MVTFRIFEANHLLQLTRPATLVPGTSQPSQAGRGAGLGRKALGPKIMRDLTIYTRGVASARGIGGYAVVLVHGDHRKELCGAVPGASNNRMDLLTAITGLRALKCRCRAT